MTTGSWSAEQKRRIHRRVQRQALRGMVGSGCWRGEVTTGASSMDRGAEMEVEAVEDVFEEVKRILRSALDGHNVCILAYGHNQMLLRL
ncbi:hypothetical protein Zm00014a_020085 [Zea mays]|uniref:Uncharacterized protein n=1 Tax=Zea mays TaxID=4577 RepID=A0A3L6DNB0_MAIZE|nr:hypothetical protein Zm00014a_020085 [Zea mays]